MTGIGRILRRGRRSVIPIMLLLTGTLVVPSHASEFRGVWVDAFHPGFKSPAETEALVARAKAANLNALFVEVRKRGDAYYASNIEPRAGDIDPTYDPLADVIEEAHAAGLEVHAWVNVYKVFADRRSYTASLAHVYAKHPEWLMRSKDDRTILENGKIMLDPGVPEARDYTISVIADIISRYDVDGIHLDSVQYLGADTGYNAISLSRFNAQARRSGTPDEKDAAWCAWRREQISSLIREVHKAAITLRPGIKVSACVHGNRSVASDVFFQDWDAWMAEGILDFAVPMVFALDDATFRQAVDDALSSAHGRHVYIGQGAWRLPAEQTVGQLEYLRSKGLPGMVVYSYDAVSGPGKDGSSILDSLKAAVFESPASTPAMPWKIVE